MSATATLPEASITEPLLDLQAPITYAQMAIEKVFEATSGQIFSFTFIEDRLNISADTLQEAVNRLQIAIFTTPQGDRFISNVGFQALVQEFLVATLASQLQDILNLEPVETSQQPEKKTRKPRAKTSQQPEKKTRKPRAKKSALAEEPRIEKVRMSRGFDIEGTALATLKAFVGHVKGLDPVTTLERLIAGYGKKEDPLWVIIEKKALSKMTPTQAKAFMKKIYETCPKFQAKIQGL